MKARVIRVTNAIRRTVNALELEFKVKAIGAVKSHCGELLADTIQLGFGVGEPAWLGVVVDSGFLKGLATGLISIVFTFYLVFGCC